MAPMRDGLAGMPMRQPGAPVAIGAHWDVMAVDDLWFG